MNHKTQLGSSQLQVHPIGFGANAIGGHNLYPDLDEEENRQMVNYIIQSDINFIDTAYAYGNGRSEEILGEVIAESGRRESLIIATKASHRRVNGETFHDNSPDFLKQAVEEALNRLQTDYIDLFYLHYPDKKTPKNEAVAALQELKEAGKIKAIGLSNFSLDQIKEANKEGCVEVVQDHYNLLHRDLEQSLFPYLQENNISFVPFFPFQSGLLTGKYDGSESFPDGDLRQGQADFQGQRFQDNVKKVQQLKPLAKKYNVSISNIVLAFYLTRGPIQAVIPGAKKPEQIDNNLKTMQVNLSKDDIALIDQLFK
ncbi:MAG: aldo/keto reductase [Atopococcus tabaci]|uniref:Aldo/keto reductase n=1 Tax=Atopococcus tabaci TaxID=269774 RepID=A0AA43UD15_9LACT|nr:aldo/keto reductase [Atopococcus tabaci]